MTCSNAAEAMELMASNLRSRSNKYKHASHINMFDYIFFGFEWDGSHEVWHLHLSQFVSSSQDIGII